MLLVLPDTPRPGPKSSLLPPLLFSGCALTACCYVSLLTGYEAPEGKTVSRFPQLAPSSQPSPRHRVGTP